jgi:hypothetical protein
MISSIFFEKDHNKNEGRRESHGIKKPFKVTDQRTTKQNITTEA